jgi:hypothetical protein
LCNNKGHGLLKKFSIKSKQQILGSMYMRDPAFYTELFQNAMLFFGSTLVQGVLSLNQ